MAEAAVPKAMDLERVKIASEQHEELKNLKKSLGNNVWDNGQRRYELIRKDLCTMDSLIWRRGHIVLSNSLHNRALELAREVHIGVLGIKQRLGTKV